MSHKVTLTRQRVVEETAETEVSASNPADAVAVCNHLVEGHKVPWKYSRTIETTEPSVAVKEVKSKR